MPSATEDTDGSTEARPAVAQRWDIASAWARPKKYSNNVSLRTAIVHTRKFHITISDALISAVSIDEQEGISPLMLAKAKEIDDFDLDTSNRHYNAYLAKRVSSRKSSASSSPSIWYAQSRPVTDAAKDSPRQGDDAKYRDLRSQDSGQVHAVGGVIDEVVAWLNAEKAKQRARRNKRKASKTQAKKPKAVNDGQSPHAAASERFRRASDASDASDDDSLDLERLESILETGLGANRTRILSTAGSSRNLRRYGSRSSQILKRQTSFRSSDTEYVDDDQLVPSCDVVLDNSMTLADQGGSKSMPNVGDGELPDSAAASLGEQDAYSVFKYEITRLAHTLKLKGWRQLPLSSSGDITVDRLSGALTNAVYVVSPPQDIPNMNKEEASGSSATRKRRPPSKLILRVYGPNVEHLIDRESELQILRRLARKHIGPRLLGTFKNGRFEEYFKAQTLRPQDLRVPETSKQIAKRMRELHDGIELLKEERNGGPFVFKNWDKWLKRAEHLATAADAMVRKQLDGNSTAVLLPNLTGFVCGTTWKFFRQVFERYRKQLEAQYGSAEKLMDQLVFAHNDTQYGNILRLEPPGESPLLLPANQHKQLVVIDFEYANANVPGLEFANHFTEWCYNYHDPVDAHKCNTAHYPSPEEQYCFIRSYVMHSPQYAPAAPSTPRFTPLHMSRSLSSLNLDARNPYAGTPQTEESDSGGGGNLGGSRTSVDQAAALDAEIQRLMHETRLWRVASSAQWVVWGILQAKFPTDIIDHGGADNAVTGSDETLKDQVRSDDQLPPADQNEEKKSSEATAEDDEFDCLNYARDRAMFFWGDCLQLGIVTKEELGEEMMKEVRFVAH